MLAPIFICAFIYHHSIGRKDDLYYYIFLDGLMMLSCTTALHLSNFIYIRTLTIPIKHAKKNNERKESQEGYK
jgi:hypothetical protein